MRFSLLVFALTMPVSAADRPLPPKDAAKAMTLPPGFKATLFAGEPEVVQPIAMTFDDRGRLWVVENLSYPNWSKDGTGKDRVIILEDTDHDGTADKRTVFYDKGANLSGIEYGFGGIWLTSIPNLLFIPDRNGDDKPDGPPEVVLDGFNLNEIGHNVINSLGWGPDGWLYGCHGIKGNSYVAAPGTPNEKRTPMNCGVWRYHPTKKTFEAYAHGTTNPFGLDWDDYGQMFITNCVIDHMWHVVPGAHFQRMYGEDLNPYVYGYMKSCVDHLHWGGGHWTSSRTTGQSGGKAEHSEAGGGHAHAGCCVMLSDAWPAEYRNNVFMANIHGNRLNRDRLVRRDTGYVGKHEPDFLFANDAWFRGLCVKQGPDGSLYVSDWTDTGECHNYKVVDQENGRVFKVTHASSRPWTEDLVNMGDEKLVYVAIDPKNEWASRHARRLLQERAAADKLTKSATFWLQIENIVGQEELSPATRLRALWTLEITDRMSRKALDLALTSRSSEVKVWGIQTVANILGTHPDDPQNLVTQRILPLAQERSPIVRMQLAALMQKLRPEDAFALGRVLFMNADDQADGNLSLMEWYGIQPAVLAEPEKGLELAGQIVNRVVRENIVRLVLTRPGVEIGAALESVVKAIGASRSEPARRDMIRGILRAYAGKRGLQAPAAWENLSAELQRSSDRELRDAAEALDVAFGDTVTIGLLHERLKKVTAEGRPAALDLLVQHRIPGLAPTLQALLEEPLMRRQALKALAAYPDAKTPAAILAKYPGLHSSEKADAVQTLASRPAFANALLDAVEKGTVPRSDVSVVAARQILALNDKATSDRLAKVWGTINPVGKNGAALVAKWKPQLDATALKTANLANGRLVFEKSCAACHKIFGLGGDVGPDLTGSQRANLDYVLENVLAPNAVVAREFQVVNFTLADGRAISGIVQRETKDAVTVRTVNDTLVISTADIETRKQTNQSIMPEGLFDAMKPEDVRDLVAYLASPQQIVPK